MEVTFRKKNPRRWAQLRKQVLEAVSDPERICDSRVSSCPQGGVFEGSVSDIFNKMDFLVTSSPPTHPNTVTGFALCKINKDNVEVTTLCAKASGKRVLDLVERITRDEIGKHFLRLTSVWDAFLFYYKQGFIFSRQGKTNYRKHCTELPQVTKKLDALLEQFKRTKCVDQPEKLVKFLCQEYGLNQSQCRKIFYMGEFVFLPMHKCLLRKEEHKQEEKKRPEQKEEEQKRPPAPAPRPKPQPKPKPSTKKRRSSKRGNKAQLESVYNTRLHRLYRGRSMTHLHSSGFSEPFRDNTSDCHT